MSSASDLQEELAPFLSDKQIITHSISTLSAISFGYGIYCVIFGLSIHALFWNGSSAHKLHKGAIEGLRMSELRMITLNLCQVGNDY
ncbi:hypothetical protein L218DRAFT_1003388 [Marasmius fiardii PR-910]|nr:hypothetical protein L218DRAFT_1003388 [Marasmius fiardii PR-910]